MKLFQVFLNAKEEIWGGAVCESLFIPFHEVYDFKYEGDSEEHE